MLAAQVRHLSGALSSLFATPLAGNILALYAVQGLNYLLPLLTLPFLLRALGAEAYGSVAFAQSIVGYAVVFVEFGFNLTAARDIAVARDDPQRIAQIYWTTTVAKMSILCVVVISLSVLLLFARFRDMWPMLAASSLLLLGNIAFPQWYFQGLERLKALAAVQALTKLMIAIGIIVFVRQPQDAWIAALLLSAPQLLGAIVMFCSGQSLAPSMFYRPSWRHIREVMGQSWHAFAGTASATLYLHANAIVLGLMCGERAVAVYSVGNRIIAALQGLGTPVTQSIFPLASRLFSTDMAAAWRFVRQIMFWVLPTFAALAALAALLAPQIVHLIAGPEYSAAVSILRIMSPLPLLVLLAILLSQTVMINAGLTSKLPGIYLTVGLLNLILLPILIIAFEAEGAAWSLLIAETLGPLLMIRAIHRYRRANRE